MVSFGIPTMSRIAFSSVLGKEYRTALETILFFNPQQERTRSEIMKSVEMYGSPCIIENGDQLQVSVEAFSDVQTLFALHLGEGPAVLAAVLIYLRLDVERIVVLHIAEGGEYGPSGAYAEEMVALRLIAKLREIARSIRGVRSLSLFYGQSAAIEIPVRRRPTA